MKKIIINENQRGLLFKNGKFVRLLGAGKHYVYGGRDIEVVDTSRPVRSCKCDLETLITYDDIAKNVSVAEVKDEHLALHFINGKFSSALPCGKYAFWSVNDTHEFIYTDISSPNVSDDVPEYVFSKIPSSFFCQADVSEYQKALVYFNRKLVKILDAGTYYFWKCSTRVDITYVDTRLTCMDIVGQEILTQDKVPLRINLACSYKITDYVRIYNEIDDFKEQLHTYAQLALREYIGAEKLDDILENKNSLSSYVAEKLKEKEKMLFIEIISADVKDIILPGAIRDIMNTVLIAEKKAQANVITRREEVASTRSLLNTAKLMDENKTLYKLKELEYIERICENVGNINLNSNSDIMAQLMGILKGAAS